MDVSGDRRLQKRACVPHAVSGGKHEAQDFRLGEYRKLDPGPVEEFFFFDHPSGRTRIYASMRWKAEHLPELEKAVPPAGLSPAQ